MDGAIGEYNVDESFPIDNGTAWITWDAQTLYIAVNHPDVNAGTSEHWLLVYIGDNSGGATQGVQFNSQQPSMTLPVTKLFRWKADNSWSSLNSWSGSYWTDVPYWIGTGGSELVEDNVYSIVEMALPFTELGVADQFTLHLSWLFEGTGSESSYSASPDTSFVSGSYDPDYTKFWAFDRTSSAAPASYTPTP
jgi:hypothetical protein